MQRFIDAFSCLVNDLDDEDDDFIEAVSSPTVI